MSSKKQSFSRRINGKGKGKESDQPFSNDDCGSTKVELDTPINSLASKKDELTPKPTFWFLARLFILQANKEDLKWLEKLIKDHENKVNRDTSQVTSNAPTENNKDEFMAKKMLKMKLRMDSRNTMPGLCNNKYGMEYIIEDFKGKKLTVSRETLQLYLPNSYDNNYVEPEIVVNPSNETQAKKISYEFIARLIEWDETFSHLRGIHPKQINDYLNKCREDGCLEKTIAKLEKMDIKILSSKRRGNYSLKKERKTASMYRELEDIRLILEKFNTFALEKRHPYFMFH
ncbi:uncharacterized protein LOC113557841 [Rhopalosiphum maidis]|uniref:uncharacterized protein LOC113557841 n=1 Tax=Rhopalosiphum maidis TaxID=43146 RepID=UPI000EFDB46E|nr:uncharacterized protein LOC113557841 [Rhopalosiphum maidis]